MYEFEITELIVKINEWALMLLIDFQFYKKIFLKAGLMVDNVLIQETLLIL